MGSSCSCSAQERCTGLACCDDTDLKPEPPRATGSSDMKPNLVELVVSGNGGLNGAIGYHSSILIADREFVYCPVGIKEASGPSSHFGDPQAQRFVIGLSSHTAEELVEFFDSIFPPSHYDLLRKNCNSFTDCALYYLCGKRLDPKFCRLERFGKMADEHTSILQLISAGEYVPNSHAAGFDVETVIMKIDALRDPHSESYDMAEVTIALDNDAAPTKLHRWV